MRLLRVLAGLAVVWMLVGCGPASISTAPPPLTPDNYPTPTTPTLSVPIPTFAPTDVPSASPEESPAPVPKHHRQLAPTRIRIPAIGVDGSQLMPLGLDKNHEIQVPPLSTPLVGGWYTGAPIPGNPGSSIMAAHVDSRGHGKGLFWALSKLKLNDRIYVERSDGKTAEFTVTRVTKYCKEQVGCPKDEQVFPPSVVYSNQSQAQLHLVTCGGRFSASQSSYLDNWVVISRLVSLKPTG